VEDPWDLPELRDTGIKWSGKLEATWGWQEGLDHCSVSPLSLFPPLFYCSDALRTRVLKGLAKAQCDRVGGDFVLSDNLPGTV
jgi:hypothetical protein